MLALLARADHPRLARVLRRWLGLSLACACLLLAACAPSHATASANPFPPFPTPTDTPYGQLPNPNPDEGPPPTNTPPADLSPRPLPAFTDWRVAYIGADGRIHAVSLNGQRDNAGSAVPLQGINGDGVWTAGSSPDGRYLAFFSPSALTIINVSSGVRQTTALPIGDTTLSWAPDQRCMALVNGPSVLCVNATTGAQVTIPLQSSQHPWVGGPYGWLDATHLVVDDRSSPATAPSILESLDTTSGSIQRIAALPIPPDGSSYAVAPGGTYTLASDAQYQNMPFTPVVDLVNNATGAVTALPHLASLLPALGGFTQVLWQPDAMQAVAVTGFPQNGDLRYWLIDVAQDTAAPLKLAGFPVAWSPDGSTLIVASGGAASDANGIGFKNIGVVGGGPFQLSAVAVDARGNLSTAVPLSSHAMHIPVLGFVHTA